MKKDEFLLGLRKALALELPESEIESNIRFYEEYINTNMKNSNEEQVIDELGDPRLIAKTIIETYQLSHGPIYQNMTSNKSNNTSYEYTDYEEESNYQKNDKGSFNFNLNTSLKWYHKLIIFLVLVMILILIIVVGSVIIRVFFTIGLPIMIIYFGYTLIKNNMKR